VSLQTAADSSVQHDKFNNNNNNNNNDNKYNYNSESNMSSLSVAYLHVTTRVPMERPQHPTTSSSSSSSSSGGAGFDVVINQSHYELYQPPLKSHDVIVYVIQLVCINYAYLSVSNRTMCV